MPGNRASRGVLLPTLGQGLVVAAAVGAAWLIWLELRGPQAGSGVNPGVDAERDSRAAALENLHTVEAIARTGPGGVPGLVDALANANHRLRQNALLALRLIGPEAGQALSAIRERLADEDARVRSLAIDAWWHIRRDPNDVAAVVASMLGDPDADVRETAARVLETIGPPAIGPVFELLESGATSGCVPALKVVRRIGWDGSQPLFDDVVRDVARGADPDVRIEALWTLAAWGRPAAAEIRELLQHKAAPDGIVRIELVVPGSRDESLHAIIRLGPDAAKNLDDVVNLLAEEQLPWN